MVPAPEMAGMCAVSVLFLRNKGLAKEWLAGAVVTTLIFTHLVLHHLHYYLMYSPAAAWLCGAAAAELESRFSFTSSFISWAVLAILALVLAISLA